MNILFVIRLGFLFAVGLVLVSCSEPSYNSTAKVVPGGFLERVYASPQEAMEEYLHYLTQDDTAAVLAGAPSYQELVRINLGLSDRDSTNKSLAETLASLFDAENRKHARRWMRIAREGNYRFKSITGGGTVQSHRGFEFHTPYEIIVESNAGDIPFPGVRSFVKTPEGYRVWTIRDVGKE